MAWVFVGGLVKKHRLDNGLTRSEYAKVCGFSRQTLYDVEKETDGRKPSVAFLEKVTARFPVNPIIFFVKAKQAK